MLENNKQATPPEKASTNHANPIQEMQFVFPRKIRYSRPSGKNLLNKGSEVVFQFRHQNKY